MTADPIPPGTATVLPVVDYEPPARPVPPHRPVQPMRLRCRRSTQPAGDRPGTVPLSPALRSVTAFADAALRRVLEVVDLRRPASHLHPLLAAGLVDSVRSADPAVIDRSGAATLQRVRAQLVWCADPPIAAEVFGSYRRDGRMHAVACRVERVPQRTGTGWQIVALHIG